MQTVTPFLWFNDSAEEAVDFYCSVFKDSKILSVNRVGEGGPAGPSGVIMATFEINGQRFMALNGGPAHAGFAPSVSFYVDCETQDEVDELWERLVDGGQPMQCGWLTDRYGLCWQIIPSLLGKLMGDPDPEKSGRVMQAMLRMVKIDSAALQRAYDGE